MFRCITISVAALLMIVACGPLDDDEPDVSTLADMEAEGEVGDDEENNEPISDVPPEFVTACCVCHPTEGPVCEQWDASESCISFGVSAEMHHDCVFDWDAYELQCPNVCG